MNQEYRDYSDYNSVLSVVYPLTEFFIMNLQVRLNGVATFIGKVGLSIAALVFIILIIR